MMHKIEKIIIRTLASIEPQLKQSTTSQKAFDTQNENSQFFEIIGFDVLIDDTLKPWLIETNVQPSFASDSPFDFKIKKDLVADTLELLGMSYKKKQSLLQAEKAYMKRQNKGFK